MSLTATTQSCRCIFLFFLGLSWAQAAPLPNQVPSESLPKAPAQIPDQSPDQAASEGLPGSEAPALGSSTDMPSPESPVSAALPIEIRDPFQKPIARQKKEPIITSSSNTPVVRQKTELEAFSLSSIRVLAILKGLNQPRAMIQAPNGKTYFILERFRLGLRNGVVQKITTDGILVRERFVNTAGIEEVVDSELKLAEVVKTAPIEGGRHD